MKITDVRLENFKGVSSDIQLEKLNLLVGANGTGKSAWLEGLQFVVMGRTSLGGRSDDTAKLIHGHFATAGIVTDGTQIVRQIMMNPKTARVQEQLVIDGRMPTRAEADGQVSAMMGTFAPMFDVGVFTSLSPDKQREFVMDLCSRAVGGTLDADAIACGIQQAMDPVKDKDLADDMIQSLVMGLPPDIVDAITTITGRAKAKMSESATDAERTRAMIQGLAQKRNSLGPAPAQTIQAMTTERKVLRQRHQELSDQLANQKGRASAITSLQGRIDGLTHQRASYQEILEASKARDISRQRAQLKELKSQIDSHESISIEETRQTAEDAVRADHDIRTELEKADKAYQGMIDALERERALLAGAEADAQSLANDPWIIARQLLTDALASMDREPEGLSLLKLHIQANADFIERSGLQTIAELKAKIQDLETAEADAATAYKSVSESAAATRKAREDAETALHEAISIQAASSAAYKKIVDSKADIERFVNDHEAHIRDVTGSMDEADREILDLQRHLDALMAEGGVVNEDEVTAVMGRTADAIETIETQIDLAKAIELLDAQMVDAAKEAAKYESQQETAKEIVNAVKRYRESMMESLVAPLLDRMNRFMATANPGASVYCDLVNDRGTRIFNLGWSTDKGRVDMAAMSGGEKAIFLTALVYALVIMADPPTKLLLVEAAELDGVNLFRLLDAISAISGDIDHAIVATCYEGLVTSTDWNWIRM